MTLHPIGVIRSPFRTPEGAPRQGAGRSEVSTIEVYEEYAAAVAGLARYDRLIVLYWADRAPRDVLKSERHRRMGRDRGVFASRSPARPNPICIAVCELVEAQRNYLRVRGLDALDGSPLLDLKPYVPALDRPEKEG